MARIKNRYGLIVSREFLTGGGIGVYFYELSQIFREKGYPIIVLTKKRKYDLNLKNINNDLIKFIYVEIPFLLKIPYYLFLISKLSPFANLIYSLLVALKIKKILKKINIAFIESPEWGGELFFYLLFFKKNNIPVIIKLHTPTFITIKLNRLKIFGLSIINYIEKFCIKKADIVFSPSISLKKIISKNWKIKRNIIIAPNPLSKKTIIQLKKSRKFKIIHKFLLYFGRLERRKGVFLISKILSRIFEIKPNIKFYFIGKYDKNTKELIIKENYNFKKNLVFIKNITLFLYKILISCNTTINLGKFPILSSRKLDMRKNCDQWKKWWSRRDNEKWNKWFFNKN